MVPALPNYRSCPFVVAHNHAVRPEARMILMQAAYDKRQSAVADLDANDVLPLLRPRTHLRRSVDASHAVLRISGQRKGSAGFEVANKPQCSAR